jgi:hypothetical protein
MARRRMMWRNQGCLFRRLGEEAELRARLISQPVDGDEQDASFLVTPASYMFLRYIGAGMGFPVRGFFKSLPRTY